MFFKSQKHVINAKPNVDVEVFIMDIGKVWCNNNFNAVKVAYNRLSKKYLEKIIRYYKTVL